MPHLDGLNAALVISTFFPSVDCHSDLGRGFSRTAGRLHGLRRGFRAQSGISAGFSVALADRLHLNPTWNSSRATTIAGLIKIDVMLLGFASARTDLAVLQHSYQRMIAQASSPLLPS